jgi:hypothetical protein
VTGKLPTRIDLSPSVQVECSPSVPFTENFEESREIDMMMLLEVTKEYVKRLAPLCIMTVSVRALKHAHQIHSFRTEGNEQLVQCRLGCVSFPGKQLKYRLRASEGGDPLHRRELRHIPDVGAVSAERKGHCLEDLSTTDVHDALLLLNPCPNWKLGKGMA